MTQDLVNYYRHMPIDIFTDTSSHTIVKPTGDISIASYGFTALYGFVPINTSINISICETVPSGEAKAIDNAINWLKWYCGKLLTKPVIRIFSDSMTSLEALNNILNFYLLKKNGNAEIQLPVDMRSSFNMAISVAALNMINSGFTFQTYYVPGHMDVFNKQKFDSKYKMFIKKFKNNNRKLQYAYGYSDLAYYEFLYYIGIYNNHIDVTTRNYMFQFLPFINNDVEYLYQKNVFTERNGKRIFPKQPIPWPINAPVLNHPIQVLQPMLLT